MRDKIFPTKEDYMNLSNCIEDCTEILKGCNIKVVNGCHYDFHTQKALGLASRRVNKITINYYFFKACIKNNDIHNLNNTMIHEMLHVVVNQIDKNIGHRGLWKQLAQKVSHNTNYNITRLANSEKINLKHSAKPAKYIIKCEDCGKEYHYQKDCKAVLQVKANNPLYFCTVCKGKVKLVK